MVTTMVLLLQQVRALFFAFATLYTLDVASPGLFVEIDLVAAKMPDTSSLSSMRAR